MQAGVSVGSRVRHRGSGELGVVLAVRAGQIEVAFGSSTQLMSPDDVVTDALDDLARLTEGSYGDPTAARLRLLSRLIKHSYVHDPGAGLSNARLEPQLHQAFVAHRVVARKVVPRMILADEVGLGKTIEAGLIIKELRARGLANRVLIIAPASLTRQWQGELASKFNESFELMDSDAAKHLGRGGTNPFARSDSIICSLPFASQSKRQVQILEASWDLVVFDEAHKVRRSTSRVTQAYRLAEEIRDLVPGLLLLTATPVQLHVIELFSLIDLVEPGLFATYQSFEASRREIPTLNQLMFTLDRWTTLTPQEKTERLLLNTSTLAALDVSSADLDDPELRDRLKDRLIEAHPLADVMVRNRKAELGLGSKRLAHVVHVSQSPLEAEVYEEVTEYIRSMYGLAGKERPAVGFLMVIYQKMLTSSSNALRTSFRKRIARLEAERRNPAKQSKTALGEELTDAEELSSSADALEASLLDQASLDLEIDTLTRLASKLDDVRDSKAVRLLELLDGLEQPSRRKVVVFTQFIETQAFLAATLTHDGYSVATFNGRMSGEEKETAIRLFRESADVLISTESGGEGRNLQFASVLVNYDLPWNPMKVEQRIGRLDRIGQTEPVQIHNLVYRDTMEERILDVLRNRIRVFEESVGSLDPILGELEQDFQRLAFETAPADLDREFERFSQGLGKRVEEARLLEETLADFVLDRASFRRDQARELLEQPSLAGASDLKQTIAEGLSYLGGSLLPHDEGGEQVTLSPKLASRLGNAAKVIHGVFDPALALTKDDLDFLAVGHPLIDKLLDALEQLPDAHVGGRESSSAPPGVSVEIIWRLSAQLVVPEARLVRHLITDDGQVHSSPLTGLPLGETSVPLLLDPGTAARAIGASREQFNVQYSQFREEMLVRADEVRQQKLTRANRVFMSQRDRLLQRISDETEWVTRAESRQDPKEQKILPARRGRIVKDQQRLEQLKADFEVQEAAITAQEADIRGEVFAVSLVRGVT